MDQFFHRLSNAYKYLQADKRAVSELTLAKFFSYVSYRDSSKSSRDSNDPTSGKDSREESSIDFESLLDPRLFEHMLTSSTYIATWDFFTQRAWGAILNQFLEELLILYNVYSPYVDAIQPKTLQYISIEKRFTRDLASQFKEYRLNAPYTNYHKLQKELLMLLKIMMEVCAEITECGIFIGARDFVTTSRTIDANERKLLSDTNKKGKYRKYISRLTAHERSKGTRKTATLHNEFVEQQTRLLDEIELTKTKLSYAKHHQCSREEQNRLILEKKERIHQSTIDEMKQQCKMENLCHSEISRYLVEARDDCQAEIEKWMTQYDKELEQRTVDNLNKKIQIENLVAKREHLKKIHDKREEQMKKWLEYKQKKQEELEQLEKEVRAATKIQAWWRGVMYRKKLGPYKKKKKNKGNAPTQKTRGRTMKTKK